MLQFFREGFADSELRRSNCTAKSHWVTPNFMILASPTTMTNSMMMIQQRNRS